MAKIIRKAQLKDVSQIHEMINNFAKKDLMLARSLNEIYENLRDFWVCVEKGKVVGCAALHVVGWQGMAEVKSLAVAENRQSKGIGRLMVAKCLREAKQLGAQKVFALTYVPDFFKKLRFKLLDKKELPERIWAECRNCPKFPNCEEIAVIKKIK